MTKRSLTKLAAIGALMVALGAFAFGTSTRSADAAPASVVVSATGACGGMISATAIVREPNGAPSVGVPVTFTTSTGGSATSFTNVNGVATAVINMPVNAVNVTVMATSGGVTGQTIVGVNCAPYNPYPVCPVYGCAPHHCVPYAPYVHYGYYNRCAPVVAPVPVVVPYVAPVVVQQPPKINVSVNPGVINCGHTSSVAINVTSGWGAPMNTGVSLTTSLGSITPSVNTIGGNAVATLSTSPGVSGVALITIRAGGVSNTASVTVTCPQPVQQQQQIVYQPAPAQMQQQVVVTRPAPAQPQRPQQVVVTRPAPAQPQRAPQFAAPRTGDAGIADMLIENDEAANAALIDAFEKWHNGEADASVADSNVSIEGQEPVIDASAVDAPLEVFDIDARLIDENVIGDSEANARLAIDLADHRAGDYGNS